MFTATYTRYAVEYNAGIFQTPFIAFIRAIRLGIDGHKSLSKSGVTVEVFDSSGRRMASRHISWQRRIAMQLRTPKTHLDFKGEEDY